MTTDHDVKAPPGDSLRLLLVDDAPHACGAVRDLLSARGYEVAMACDGCEALSLFRTEPFDVLIVGFHLSDMTGLQFMNELHADSPHTPIIFRAQSSDPATVVQVVRAGAVDLAAGSPGETELLHALDRAGAACRRERDLIGERRARRKAEFHDRAKSELLANMSHELRTPMTAILGFAETILLTEQEQDHLAPQCVDAANAIVRNGRHLLELINSILDLSKLEAGKQAIHKSQVSPSAVASDVIALLHDRAAAKGVGLQMAGKGPLPESIWTDPTRLRQILINLCGNAIKFTEKGEVRLEISYTDSADGGRLQFDVLDTGIGIPPEQLGKLFRPFARIETADTRQYGGTGLGLAISKKLAQLMNGDITVSSETGVGSCFSLTIPTAGIDRSQLVEMGQATSDLARRENPVHSQSAPKLSCRVLLAEDGADNQRLIALILGKAGADVTLAENGRQAVDLALDAWRRGQPFDVILMDIQMPVLNGCQATRALREEGYRGPVIALTAHAMRGDREKCLRAGCDDYATKPIDRNLLLTLVAELVQQPQAVAP